MKFAFLWTDLLVYLMVTMVLITAYRTYHKEHLRIPWRKVLSDRLGMSAAVVVTAFVLVGLADSVHFRESLPQEEGQEEVHYSSEVLSSLDLLIRPLKENNEKTYSSPLSVFSYVKEADKESGTGARVFPRLTHAGLDGDGNPLPVDAIRGDISVRILLGVLVGLGVSILFALLVIGFVSRTGEYTFGQTAGHIAKDETPTAWRSIILTFSVMSVAVGVMALLAANYHLFGTDKVGQDTFYQTIKSIRVGLILGTVTTIVTLPFAILLGISAGYFGGKIDDIIQYIYTTLSSIPGILLIASAVLMLQVFIKQNPDMFESTAVQEDARLLFLCLILGVTSWTGLCRILRAETLKIRELDYVVAARAFGVSGMKIIMRHILPNVMHLVLISVVLGFSGLVLAEAVLSYVGVGVASSMNSWGNMINAATQEMAREPIVWWPLLAAFVFMFTLVLAANLFSDAIRDAFDPRLVKK
jgi:peptide/nickel transport system permease protein